jgi:hypothetical protein
LKKTTKEKRRRKRALKKGKQRSWVAKNLKRKRITSALKVLHN